MYGIYKIKEMDSLESIAALYNTTVNNLLEMNKLNDRINLRVGDNLIVPNQSKRYFEYYTIRQGDNIYQIAKKYNINPDLLSNLNGLKDTDYIYPGQTILIPKSNYSYYITKQGDTLDSVVNVFGTTKDKFFEDNDIIYLLEDQLLVKRNN